MKRRTRALINLAHLKKNLAGVKSIVGRSRIMAVVKADAYGHGMTAACKALTAADAFAVAHVDEALEIRAGGIRKPIVALQGFGTAEELQSAITHDIQVVVHHPEQLKILKHVPQAGSLEIHLKLDTGMGRLGFHPSQFKRIIAELNTIMTPPPTITAMTHLACADQPDNPATAHQLKTFDRALEQEKYPRSVANSAAILTLPQSHYDWVRPGLMLYGVNPLAVATKKAVQVDLRPAMSLCAPLISVKTCRRGTRIGYGGEYRCPRDMVTGIVAAGYADGYPRHLKHASDVFVCGRRAPVVGRVSMDMIAVDLTSVEARVGEKVELWGDNISVSEISAHAETISYELLCAAGNAVDKEYIR